MPRPRMSNLSITALRAEIQKRLDRLPKLVKQRDEMSAQIAELEAVASEPRLTAPPRVAKRRGRKPGRKPALKVGRRKRAKNKMTLADALVEALKGKEKVAVPDAVGAVLAAGYKTAAKSFRSVVNHLLFTDKRFRKVARGLYALRTGTSAGPARAKAKKAARKRRKPVKKAATPAEQVAQPA